MAGDAILHDVELPRQVHLSQDEGVNLAGIKRIIELTSQVEALQSRLQEMAEELAVAVPTSEVAVVKYTPWSLAGERARSGVNAQLAPAGERKRVAGERTVGTSRARSGLKVGTSR